MTEVFDPPVGSWKRVQVLDDIRWKNGEFVFQTAGSPLKPIEASTNDPQKKHFHAKYILELQAGRPAPIPTPAAETEWITYQSEPDATLTFYKDASDNYYIQSDRSRHFEIHAFFQTPTDLNPYQSPIGLKPNGSGLPGIPAQQIAEVISKSPAAQLIRKSEPIPWLLRYFREFMPGDLSRNPVSHIDTLKLILNEKKGICRHRAFAFALLARHLGYRVRIVMNEVHAFIEMERDGHWFPLELGGAASSITVRNLHSNTSERNENERFYYQGQHGNTTERIPFSTATIHADNASSKETFSGSFEVPRENTRPTTVPAMPRAFLSRLQATPPLTLRGQETTISGELRNANGALLSHQTFHIALASGAHKISMGDVTTDQNGQFSVKIRIPSQFPVGKATLQWTSRNYEIVEK